MAALFSQNPLMNGPNYSFSDVPKTANGDNREHRFNPYVTATHSPASSFNGSCPV
jgi:hypothetical protein